MSALLPIRLSAVIATLGRPDRLASTLASLSACRPEPAELIVVDGDDAQSARAVVEAHARAVAPAVVRYEPSPPGLTRQRNRGIDVAGGDVVVFADDDVEFALDLFARLGSAYEDSAVVGATVRYDEPGRRRGGGASRWLRRVVAGRGAQGTMTAAGYPRRITDLDNERDIEFMHGCLMSARRELAARVRFDETLPGYALAEDEDFGYRLSRAGRIRYVAGARVIHHAAGIGSMHQHDFNRQLVVNRAYLFRKNFASSPASRAQFAAIVALLAAHRVLQGSWAGARGVLAGAREAWALRHVRPEGPTATDAEALRRP
jgi:GT2 family glycosyltransferase